MFSRYDPITSYEFDTCCPQEEPLNLSVVKQSSPSSMDWPFALHRIDLDTDKSGSSVDICRVCGIGATGMHYGTLTCEGCKGFFKRSVQSKKVYSCKNAIPDSCEIKPGRKDRCQACRFQKCLDKGMVVAAVRENRQAGGRNRASIYQTGRNISEVTPGPVASSGGWKIGSSTNHYGTGSGDEEALSPQSSTEYPPSDSGRQSPSAPLNSLALIHEPRMGILQSIVTSGETTVLTFIKENAKPALTSQMNHSPTSIHSMKSKRPLHAFNIYSKLHYKAVAQEYKGKHRSELAKVLGEQWRSLTAADRQPYLDEAARIQTASLTQFGSDKHN